MSTYEQKTILIVDDDDFCANFTSKIIRKSGFGVLVARTGEAAFEIASTDEKIDLILMDIELGSGIDGSEAARRILEKRNVPIVFLTSHTEREYVDRVADIAGYGYVVKNSSAFVLRSSIDMALKLFEAHEKLTNELKERMQVESDLMFSNIIMRTQQESSIDGILVVDEDGKILSFNQRFVDMWGIPDDVIESKSDDHALQSVMDKLASPEEFLRKVTHLYKVRDEISRDEIVLKDGRLFDRYSAPMLDACGKHYGRVWYFRDITDRKRAEEKIQDLLAEKELALNVSKNSLELLNGVLNSSSDGIMVMRPVEDESGTIIDYKCLFSNKVASFFLGYEENKLNGSPVGGIIYDIDEGGLFDMYSKTFKTGMPLYYDHSVTFHGEKSWFQFFAVKHNESIITTFTDVSYKKEAEKTLQEQLFLNEVILDSITDPMMLINRQKRILVFNKAAGALGADDYMTCWKLPWDEDCFIKKEDLDANEDQFQIFDAAISNNMPFDITEIRMFEKIWCVHVIPVYDETYLFYANDITAHKNMEEKLKKTADVADAANKLKGRFLAVTSHEIRTPMNSIIGFSDILDKTELNFEQKEMVHYIRTSGRALLELINDILDFSKIEANKISVENIEFSLIDVIYEVYSISKISAINKKIELTYSIDARQNYNLFGDPARIRQIILNLTSNAIKFTEKGQVTIKVDIISETNDDSSIKISVVDSGIGIASGEQEKIFAPFVQADGTVTRKFGGTGLGLSISNELVKLMGGEKIFVESFEGKGSNFYFILKFIKGSIFSNKERPAKARAKAGTLDTNKRYKVLFAEDNEANIRLGLKLLEARGFYVTVAENGETAVEKARTERFDIILMDVQMPVMDGLEASKQIRKAGIKTPIIAMTATAMREDRLKCINAGMDSFLSKPLNIDEFMNEIIEFIGSGKNAVKSNKNKVDDQEKTVEKLKPSSDLLTAAKIIDVEKLSRNMNGKKELMQDAISMFVEYHERYMFEIHQAVRDRDAKKLRFSAHKLKGTAMMAGMTRVANILSTLEKMGENGIMEGSSEFLKKAEDEIVTFKEEIKTIQL